MNTLNVTGELKRFLFLLGAFFILTPLTVMASLASLVSLSKDTKVVTKTATIPHVQILAASTQKETSSITFAVNAADARVALVRNYLARYDSPIVHLAEYIVKVSDQNGIDFRYIPAIAQQESNLCKKIPEETYNCWGWGIHARGTLGFTSYEEGIETVTKGLKKEYFDKGYTTPEKIMTKYTPSSPGSWARGVSMFMEEMQ
jgi:hypothetical protein